MPKSEEENVACYWQSDSSPIPVIKVEKTTTRKKAEKWLKSQKPSNHWTPKIGVLTVTKETETLGIPVNVVSEDSEVTTPACEVNEPTEREFDASE